MALAASPNAALADIVIATVGPLTGQYSAFGAQMKEGASLAVKQINEAGGVLGEKLVLEIADDQCDAKQAVAVANQLLERNVPVVVGHFCSSASIQAAAIYQEEKVVQISPASTNPRLTDESGRGVFRTCGRDDAQGAVAGNYLADHFPDARVAVVHDGSDYGKGLADETRKQMAKRGKQAAMYAAYKPSDSDFTELAAEMKDEEIDIIYVGGYHREAALILKQARQLGLTARLVSGDALVTHEFWELAGPAAEGTLMTFSPDPRKNPAAEAVVEEYRAHGIEPEGYVLYTYAAVQVWAQAAAKAGTTDFGGVVDSLHEGTFDTVLGSIGFDARGDVTAPAYVVYEWRDGSYDYVTR
jgi:branched-chain amino acid transport system substrate-binding protein